MKIKSDTIGLALGIASVISFYYLGEKIWLAWVVPILLLIFYFYFTIVSLKEFILTIMRKWYWSRIKIFCHISALFIAATLSRLTISKHFGLPSHYFPMTLSFSIGIHYIPALVIVLSLITILYSLFHAVKTAFFNLLRMPIIFSIFTVTRKFFKFKEIDIKEIEMRSAYIMIGGFFISCISALISGELISIVGAYKAPYEYIAYVSDFQEMAKYPCLPKNGKVILMDNNLLAQATKEDSSRISIQVQKINSGCSMH